MAALASTEASVDGKRENTDLPEEPIGEILFRADVKTIVRFRCVSKSWWSFISTKKFIKDHMQQSVNNPNLTCIVSRVYCKSIYDFSSGLRLCSFKSLLEKQFTPTYDYGDVIYHNNDIKRTSIVGCCHGMICVEIHKEIFIWNPSTRISKKLPSLFDPSTKGILIDTGSAGFGYDELNDDYKVLMLVDDKSPCHVKLYSARTNLWKSILDLDVQPFDGCSKFVSGKLHWVKWDKVSSTWEIVSFDLGSEMPGLVEAPARLIGNYIPDLGLLEGCLCVFSDYQRTHAELWVMQHYGLRESWRVMVRIPCTMAPQDEFYSVPLSLCIAPNGEMLCILNRALVIYNPKSKSYRKPQVSWAGYQMFSRGECDVYVQSLVSPFLDGDAEENWHEWMVSKIYMVK